MGPGSIWNAESTYVPAYVTTWAAFQFVPPIISYALMTWGLTSLMPPQNDTFLKKKQLLLLFKILQNPFLRRPWTVSYAVTILSLEKSHIRATESCLTAEEPYGFLHESKANNLRMRLEELSGGSYWNGPFMFCTSGLLWWQCCSTWVRNMEGESQKRVVFFPFDCKTLPQA